MVSHIRHFAPLESLRDVELEIGYEQSILMHGSASILFSELRHLTANPAIRSAETAHRLRGLPGSPWLSDQLMEILATADSLGLSPEQLALADRLDELSRQILLSSLSAHLSAPCAS